MFGYKLREIFLEQKFLNINWIASSGHPFDSLDQFFITGFGREGMVRAFSVQTHPSFHQILILSAHMNNLCFCWCCYYASIWGLPFWLISSSSWPHNETTLLPLLSQTCPSPAFSFILFTRFGSNRFWLFPTKFFPFQVSQKIFLPTLSSMVPHPQFICGTIWYSTWWVLEMGPLRGN